MKLSLKTVPSINRRFILLSPPGVPLRGAFRQVDYDAVWRQELLSDMQRLRGRVYLDDGAILEQDLAADGRHVQPIDEESWHLLIVNRDNRVVGCTRYLQHPLNTSFNRLRVRTAALARSERWSGPLRWAVESELDDARRSGFSYVEVGGWALDESVRGSADALRSVLFTFAWAQVIGGCLGLSMATHRNGSAAILRRIGGRPLEWDGQALPPYYDPQYKCDMEVIRFDSRLPSVKYRYAIDEIRLQIPTMQVVAAERPWSAWHVFVNPLHSRVAALVPSRAHGVAPAA
jgi:hypothetical protein